LLKPALKPSPQAVSKKMLRICISNFIFLFFNCGKVE
jgi:hypothetical protein